MEKYNIVFKLLKVVVVSKLKVVVVSKFKVVVVVGGNLNKNDWSPKKKVYQKKLKNKRLKFEIYIVTLT